ncbi:gamma-glutamylcyclotransferase [Candidatus Nitrospira nitrificans]|uniref:Gamma-glutamylcyclotransferase n=1 Tax=Candidatus Nitrospira nitrificans TaxID=1742973 RepID=A0A0S4LK49_9BACT|nr:gamma-glutamylcyclotransferase [Candidatus Nitrospira nitrificans]CUS37647.1 hypothetical protein COMA2_300003 [Candidatus Nitrospira nitrificans]
MSSRSVRTCARLRFNKRSQDGSGKANVEPDPAGEVWGVLYALPDHHLAVLDRGEGQGYARRREIVRTRAGADVHAWVYVAVSPAADPTLRPYGWYKRFLVEGAREHRLPDPYVKTLEAIESMDDPNAARDRQKRSLSCEAAG